MSILSKQEDGLGYFYGWLPGCPGQLNVRYDATDQLWHTWVGGELVGAVKSKDEAEALAVAYAESVKEAE
jgi:hypothetical protein